MSRQGRTETPEARQRALGEAIARAKGRNAEMKARLERPREGHCEDCDRDYTIWYADNDLWNAVMRASGPPTEREPFLCATCFLIRAESLTEFARVTWPRTPSRRDRERKVPAPSADACGQTAPVGSAAMTAEDVSRESRQGRRQAVVDAEVLRLLLGLARGYTYSRGRFIEKGEVFGAAEVALAATDAASYSTEERARG